MSSYIFNPKDWKKTTLTDEMLDEIKADLNPVYLNVEGDSMTGALICSTISANTGIYTPSLDIGTNISFPDNSIQTTAFDATILNLDTIVNNKLKLAHSLKFNDNTIQTTAFRNNIPDVTTINTKLTDISYESRFLKTTIANNCLINNLTCNNINTSHLSSTTSNLQSQITASNSSLQTQITTSNTDLQTQITTSNTDLQSQITTLSNATSGIGTIYSEVSSTFEFAVSGVRPISYNIPKGVYIVTSLLQLWQKSTVNTSQWTTNDYATFKIDKTSNNKNVISVYPQSSIGNDYRFPRNGTSSQVDRIQFDLGTIHIIQPNTDASRTNFQVLQLEYNLVMTNYTTATASLTEPEPLPDPDPLAIVVSTKPEGVLMVSFMKIGNV